MGNTLKLVHKNFSPISSGSTHTVLFSPYASSLKGFDVSHYFFGSNSTHTTYFTAGWQYIDRLVVFITKSWEEVCSAQDTEYTTKHIKQFDELCNSFVGQFDGVVDNQELVNILDQWVVKHIKYYDEGLVPTDTQVKFFAVEDRVPIREDWVVKHIKYFSEKLKPREDSDAFMVTDFTDTINIMIGKYHDETDTVAVGTSGAIDVTDSVNFAIVPETRASVTSASGNYIATPNNPIEISLTDPSPTPLPFPYGDVTYDLVVNEFQPTIILDGVVHASAVTTLPPVYGPQTNFVQWVDVSLPGGADSCSIQDFSFRLGFDGGGFSLLTASSVGAKGTAIKIFGLDGTIIETGEKISNSAYGYTTNGIFGSPSLNKEFNIINYGNQYYIEFLGSQVLYPFNVNQDQQMTVLDMVRNIAHSTGIKVGYYTIDSPYLDPLSQSGQTGYEALSSLASQVGAQLRYSGTNFYSIVPPNFYQGTFTVPGQSLITADGIEYKTILDLGLGVSGTGVLQIPRSNYDDVGTNTLPDTPIETIEKIWSTRKKLEQGEDPVEILDLPADAFDVKMQILLDPDGGAATGVNFGVTTDPNSWVSLGGPSLTNRYVKLGTYWNNHNPKVVVDYSLFPNITPVNNGKFVMSIGYTRANSLAIAFAQQQEDQAAKQRDLVARMLANIRYIKTYEGSISCYFFGVIPLPGMWGKATVCGKTVEGIIESVNFSAPGILTIQLAQYLRVNFLDAKTNLVSNPLNVVI